MTKMKPKRPKNEFKRSAIFKRIVKDFVSEKKHSAWRLVRNQSDDAPKEVDMSSAPTYRRHTAKKVSVRAPKMTRMHYSDDEDEFNEDDNDFLADD